MHTKRNNTCSKRLVQFRVVAIPRLPEKSLKIIDKKERIWYFMKDPSCEQKTKAIFLLDCNLVK